VARGFQVNSVYPNRMMIDFSGAAGLVKAAFHTEIHRLDVNGAAHIANANDPFIPAALQPVVAGIVSLNDFRPRPKHKAALALERIRKAVAHLPSYATPRKVWLTVEPWTVGAGLMTPTLKLKRQAIESAFATEIASLYAK
jgi:hypothetical protein